MAIEFKPASPPEKAKGIIATAPIKPGTKLDPVEVQQAITKLMEPPKNVVLNLSIPRGRPSTGKAKKAVTIRLDQDVVAALEARKDWRTEVNAILRTHLKL